jgi:hypothetical protein
VSEGSDPPVLRVITPHATDEEVAALLAVLSSLGADEPAPKPISAWADPHRRLRRTFPHGPGGWRTSALPR